MKTSRRVERVIDQLRRAEKEAPTYILKYEIGSVMKEAQQVLEHAKVEESQISIFAVDDQQVQQAKMLQTLRAFLRESAPYIPGSDTSEAAARRVATHAPNGRLRVLSYLAGRGPATDDQIAEALGMFLGTARPRRVELLELGLVVDSGFTSKTSHGCDAVEWKATRAARDIFRAYVR